jgi:hypothetical protein
MFFLLCGSIYMQIFELFHRYKFFNETCQNIISCNFEQFCRWEQPRLLAKYVNEVFAFAGFAGVNEYTWIFS